MVVAHGRRWIARGRDMLAGGIPLVMGIVNATPDSFSGGTPSAAEAVSLAVRLIEEGADIIDIGGESTRPGAAPVDADEESRRVVPVIESLARSHPQACISIDTMKAVVARRALEAGARIINDVSSLEDPLMAPLAAETGAGLVLMHMRGNPANMQVAPHYGDVVAEVVSHLESRARAAMESGVGREQIALDPGIGFGKTLEHNLQLLANLSALRRPGMAVLLGVSRKSFLGAITGRPVGERLAGTLAAQAVALARGQADIIRVHDVREAVDMVKVVAAIGGFHP